MGLFDKQKSSAKAGNKPYSVTSQAQLIPEQFYKQCLDEFHATGGQLGFTKKGVVFIPELITVGGGHCD